MYIKKIVCVQNRSFNNFDTFIDFTSNVNINGYST